MVGIGGVGLAWNPPAPPDGYFGFAVMQSIPRCLKSVLRSFDEGALQGRGRVFQNVCIRSKTVKQCIMTCDALQQNEFRPPHHLPTANAIGSICRLTSGSRGVELDLCACGGIWRKRASPAVLPESMRYICYCFISDLLPCFFFF